MDEGVEMTHEVMFGDIPAMMELWVWDGITGSSVVFHNEDVYQMSENELVDFTFSHMPSVKDKQYTFKKVGQFIFINFGFSASD